MSRRRWRLGALLVPALLASACATNRVPPDDAHALLPLEGWSEVRAPGLAVMARAPADRIDAVARPSLRFRAAGASFLSRRHGATKPVLVLLFEDAEELRRFAGPRASAHMHMTPDGPVVAALRSDVESGDEVLQHELGHVLVARRAPTHTRGAR